MSQGNLLSSFNWSKCFLCHLVTAEKFKGPFPDGFKALISNLLQFKESNETPMYTDITVLDNGHGTEECLQTKEAKGHKSCHLKINNTKLEWIKCHRSDTIQDSYKK